MKKIKIFGTVLALVLMGFTSSAMASSNGVPQKVKEAFTKKFPSITKVKWNQEVENEWEAEFKMEGTAYSANFSENGIWMETEHEIKKSAIPTPIQKVLATEFAGYKIEEAEISETSLESVYEFELEKGEIMMEVAINKAGKVVKKEIMNEEDND